MPPSEKPIDPESPFASFAIGLRALRLSSRLKYRKMAELTHYSKTVLSDAANGIALPTLAVTIAYVRVCGGPEQEWVDLWQRENARRRTGGDLCG